MLNSIPRAVGVAALLFAAAAPGQDAGDLARVVLIEEQEHDLTRAETGYRTVASGQGAASVRAEAFLRLGALLRKMGREEEAKAALGRAVAFKGAPAATEAQALLRQDPQDPERKKALRKRVKELIAEWEAADFQPGPWWELKRNLEWIGPVAVPELVRIAEPLAGVKLKHATTVYNGRQWTASSALTAAAELVFSLGGEEAVAFLKRVQESPSVRLRRAVARAFHTEMGNEWLYPIAARMTRDLDVSVARSALGASGTDPSQHGSRWVFTRLPIQAVVDAAQHPARDVRQHAFDILRNHWGRLPHDPDQEATVRALLPILERDLRGVDPERALDAAGVMVPAIFAASDGRRLILDHLDRMSDGFLLARQPDFRVSTGDEHLERIVALAKRNEIRQFHATGAFLRNFVAKGRGWDRTAVPFLLELDRVGVPARSKAIALAEAEDAPLLVQCLAETKDRRIVEWLHASVAAEALPEGTWPALEALSPSFGNRTLVPELAGRTGHPGAVQWLLDGLSDPSRKDACAWGLFSALDAADRADVRDAVRQILTCGLSDVYVYRAVERLVRVGDPVIVDVIVRGELPLGRLHYVHPETRGSIPAALLSQKCGLSLEDRMRALHAILERSSRCWHILGLWMAPSLEQGRNLWSRPDTVAIAREPDPEAAKALLARARAEGIRSAARRAFGSWALRRANGDKWVDDGWFEDFLNGNDSFTHMAVRALERGHVEEPKLLDRHGDRLLEIVQLEEPQVAGAALTLCLSDRGGLSGEKRTRAIALGLAHPDRSVRNVAVYKAHRSFTPEQIAQSILDPELRATICPLVPVDAGGGTSKIVAALLSAIADSRFNEQKQLMDALERIRVYQDQKAHWDRVFAGVDTSSNAAAEKLLEQADPKQRREVRLLAIRSLGSLGVPETLPFLIDWSQGEDAEIAKASLAAIEQIHRTGR